MLTASLVGLMRLRGRTWRAAQFKKLGLINFVRITADFSRYNQRLNVPVSKAVTRTKLTSPSFLNCIVI